MRIWRRGLISLVLLTMVSGCWSAKELNTLGIVVAMGIDKASNGRYLVTFQVVDPSQMSVQKTQNRSPVFLYKQEAQTIFEAVRKVTTKSSRRLYGAHIQIVVLGESLARDGISQPMDILFRDFEVRPNVYIAVAKRKRAEDIVALVTPFEIIPAIDMAKSLEVSEKAWAPSVATTVLELMQMLQSHTRQPVITGIALIGNIQGGMSMKNVENPLSEAEYQYQGLAVFRKDRLIGWLNETESKAYSYLTNRVKNTVGKVSCPNGGLFAVKINQAAASLKPSLRNGKPVMDVSMVIKGDIGEVQCQVDLTKEKTILVMQRSAEKQLHNIVNQGITTMQNKYKVDNLGFGEAFHRKYPLYWNSHKDEWDELFSKMDVNLEFKVKLRTLGKINNPIN
ncbi:Ger(x)C family spore germination protein [Paenibacillus sp. GCM10023252]|uniref:Ger(x)C family spore germination protein n=1 Tax=Paenibacillus sp. GCM10023252 TaxID=3252649 RepID=UPI0036154177